MLAKQTTTYTLPTRTPAEYAEARKFAEGVEAFYGWGGAKVQVIHDEQNDLLIVSYYHIIETNETIFGGK